MASLLEIGALGLAGAIGALARYLLGHFVAERVRSAWPWGTLLINISGAFCIGLLFALTERKLMAPALQLMLTTGFLGGYTTFSTMSWEGVQLAHRGSTQLSLLYLGGSLALGLIAVALGLAVGWLG
jgi:CrcB protein